MQNVQIMKLFEPKSDLNQRPPNGLFVKSRFFLLMFHYFLIKVAVVRELHDDAA